MDKWSTVNRLSIPTLRNYQQNWDFINIIKIIEEKLFNSLSKSMCIIENKFHLRLS